MEETWDMLLPVAQCKTRSKCDINQSSVQASKSMYIQCSIYPGKIHFLNVIYVHNPRDIDMHTWLLDGKEKGKIFW